MEIRTVDVIIPVRPAVNGSEDIRQQGKDIYPLQPGVETKLEFNQQVMPCRDGNLSKLYREAYMASNADVVIFKHDDLCIRDWLAVEAQLQLLEHHICLGFAGARSYSPMRHAAWWQQAPQARDTIQNGYVDGVCRGIVSHKTKGTGNLEFLPTFFGPPGKAVVMDGCCLIVARNCITRTPYGHDITPAHIATCFDPIFTFHFYDIAFTLNLTKQFGGHAGIRSACYVIGADVAHVSPGDVQGPWEQAAKIFARAYPVGMPLEV